MPFIATIRFHARIWDSWGIIYVKLFYFWEVLGGMCKHSYKRSIFKNTEAVKGVEDMVWCMKDGLNEETKEFKHIGIEG